MMKRTKTILLFFAVSMFYNIDAQLLAFEKQPLSVKFYNYDSLRVSDVGEAQVDIRIEYQVQGQPDSPILVRQDTSASFPGGSSEWLRFLSKNLDMSVVYNSRVVNGSYQVTVQFDVDERGKVGNVKAIEVPKACAACGREAVRVIKRGPRWVAASEDGRSTTSQVTRRITFQVAND